LRERDAGHRSLTFALDDYTCGMRKLLLAISLLLIGVGLAILADDLHTFYRCGFHSNEVAGITEEGGPIDWPTGEIPWFAQVSAGSWVSIFWLSGAGAFSLRFFVRTPYHGLILRGTE
jgi:hypothetical protein